MEKRRTRRYEGALAKTRALLKQTDGPLTRRLLRTPGRFGLGQVPAAQVPDTVKRLVCGYCSTGCALTAHLQAGEAVNLSPDAGYPVNLGMACPKGWEALAPLEADDRATRPLLRGADGRLAPVGWAVAIRELVRRFRAVAGRDGPEAMAFLSTGQITTEEMFLLGTLAKFGMGMVHGDGNTRQCMATAVVAYKEAFGFDAPPYTFADFEASDVIVLVGSNLCIAHPIMWERVCRNRQAPEIIVVDPRRTETAMAATKHYALRPKSDLPLFYAVAHELIRCGGMDEAFIRNHTEGFEGYRRFVEAYPPEGVARDVGLAPAAIRDLARTIQRGRRVSFWWTMGVNQGHEAVRTAQSLINLALMTGNIGRPGTGANSITGQCNAMGSRLFSNTTCLVGGYDFTEPSHRAKVAGELGIDETRIPNRPGLTYDQILDRIRAKEIRALWIVGTNTAHSWIDQTEAREALEQLDVLVVQDLYANTETAQLADLVLPAAGWGEKEGTFINSERRIGRIRKVRRAPGEALADFHIFRLVAAGWGCETLVRRWTTPEDVFRTMQALSRGQPCDISGIRGYDQLDDEGGVQWPFPEGEKPPGRERRLFEDGRFFRHDGKARFCYGAPGPPRETPDDRYPFVLLTGRGSSSQWHTETRTRKSPVLRKLYRDECIVEIHPKDASRMGITAEGWVTVTSRRGSLRARARVGETVQEGELFISMHDAATNRLTCPSFDPFSRQPSYKHCAVSIAPVR